MKKIISLVLCFVMIMAFASVASAAEPYSGTASAGSSFFTTTSITITSPLWGRDTNKTVKYSGGSTTTYTSRIYYFPTATSGNSSLSPAMNTILQMSQGDYKYGSITNLSPVNKYKYKCSNGSNSYSLTITGSYDVWK